MACTLCKKRRRSTLKVQSATKVYEGSFSGFRDLQEGHFCFLTKTYLKNSKKAKNNGFARNSQSKQ